MAGTRREQLAALIADADSGKPGDDAGNLRIAEANGPRPEAEAGFPFELLSGSGVIPEEEIPTRVKKPSKDDKPADKPAARRNTAVEREIAEIEETLNDKIGAAFMLAGGLAPVTSVYGAENSEKAVTALMGIARRRPGILKYIRQGADVIDVLEIAKFFGGLVIAVQVDAQKLRGDELPARAFGVTEILEQHFWNEDTMTNPAVMVQAPRYAPV